MDEGRVGSLSIPTELLASSPVAIKAKVLAVGACEGHLPPPPGAHYGCMSELPGAASLTLLCCRALSGAALSLLRGDSTQCSAC